MVNQQLVDYIKQQLQGGVAKDAIKKALLDAGWPTADVEDSMKAAEPAAVSQPAAAQKIDPASAMVGAAAAGAAVSATSPLQKSESTFFSEPGAPVEHASNGSKIAMIVMGSLIVVLLAALGYIYFNLNGRVSTVSGESAASASEAEALRSQIQQLTNDKTSLTSQVATLTQQGQSFSEEIGFIAVPATSTASEVEATIHGTVSGSSSAYYLTTSHGLKVTVKNSKDARVDAALKPLIGQVAAVTGTHRPAMLDITVTAVNGTALTTAATSTPPTATTTKP